MSHFNFIICKEHKFFGNIFSNDELSKTDALKDLKTFHGKFVRFLRVAVFLQNSFKIKDELMSADCSDFGEIKDLISSAKKKKNPKFTLQTYAFVYQRSMDFPHGRFDYETLTTLSLHRIINVKTYLHHSHVTGKIIGYAHDFCNMKIRENQNQFSCIVHNFFGFDMFILIKGIRLSVWATKDVNIGGTGLTNIDFASITNQLKFIDTMKYFPTSLGQLPSTLDDVEKKKH